MKHCSNPLSSASQPNALTTSIKAGLAELGVKVVYIVPACQFNTLKPFTTEKPACSAAWGRLAWKSRPGDTPIEEVFQTTTNTQASSKEAWVCNAVTAYQCSLSQTLYLYF